jgi:SOS-response transcriptional repressor LexA
MTPRQEEVYRFVYAYIAINKYPPSYSNIAKALKVKGKGNIHRMLYKLQEEGYIVIKPHKCRSLKIADKTVQKVSKL